MSTPERSGWRATLAHEGTHVLLHGLLFDLNADQQPLFDDDLVADDRVIRCYKRNTSFAGRSRDPREFQANKGMAALLMPRSIFGEAARDLVAATDPVRDVVEQIARRLEVSRQAASIRLSDLGYLSNDGASKTALLR